MAYAIRDRQATSRPSGQPDLTCLGAGQERPERTRGDVYAYARLVALPQEYLSLMRGEFEAVAVGVLREGGLAPLDGHSSHAFKVAGLCRG